MLKEKMICFSLMISKAPVYTGLILLFWGWKERTKIFMVVGACGGWICLVHGGQLGGLMRWELMTGCELKGCPQGTAHLTKP